MRDLNQIVFDSIDVLKTDRHPRLRDTICGEETRLSCFRDSDQCRGHRYSQPELAIKVGPAIVGVMEIEVAGESVSPKTICRKVFALAMCHLSIAPGPRNQERAIPLKNFVFVQILDCSTLPLKSAKMGQYQNLQDDINSHLSPNGSIRQYHLLAGSRLDFQEGLQRDRLCTIFASIIFGS